MSLITIFFIAVGLAADAFAVSVANGIALKSHYKMYCSLIFGFYFGFFQFIMPIIGFFMGTLFSEAFGSISQWIAFMLLVLIGFKMINESVKNKAGCVNILEIRYILSLKNMCILSVATSIDACAVGVSLALTQTPLLLSSVIIGLVAFVCSGIGVYIGNKIGGLFQKSSGIIGGIILISIGFKILLT